MLKKYRRVKHYDEPGDAHFLTFSCYHGLPLLNRERTRLWFVDAVAKARRKHRFDLWAWVVMPEHAHLLLWPRAAGYKIEKILQTIKSSVGVRAIAYLRRHAPAFLAKLRTVRGGVEEYHFWQEGPGYDRNTNDPREIHEIIQYIHNNPVRRGLVERPEDWLFSSARVWLGYPNPLLTIDRDSVLPLYC
jgi:putative transposase